jgi:hypothetical protein
MLLRCESCLQPRDGRMAHTVATRDIHQRLARLAPCQSLLPFRDPLLVRVGRDLALTRNAEELIVPLREALDRIQMTLRQKARFDPRLARLMRSSWFLHLSCVRLQSSFATGFAKNRF